MTEAWLSGPLPGVDPALMPAAHALIQARRDLTAAAEGASPAELWERPGGAALAAESTSGATAGELITAACTAIDAALEQIRATPSAAIFDARTVGRAALPATVIGFISHAGEHTARHVGQLITTLKVVRGTR